MTPRQLHQVCHRIRTEAAHTAVRLVHEYLQTIGDPSIPGRAAYAREMIEEGYDGRFPCHCRDPVVIVLNLLLFMKYLRCIQTSVGLWFNSILLKICAVITRSVDRKILFKDLAGSPPIGVWILAATTVCFSISLRMVERS